MYNNKIKIFPICQIDTVLVIILLQCLKMFAYNHKFTIKCLSIVLTSVLCNSVQL